MANGTEEEQWVGIHFIIFLRGTSQSVMRCSTCCCNCVRGVTEEGGVGRCQRGRGNSVWVYWQMLRLTNLKMKRVRSSSVGCTCEGGQSSLLQPSYSTGQPVGPNTTTASNSSPQLPTHWWALLPLDKSCCKSSMKAGEGGAAKKLGVCWRENSRGHELPAVVFKAEILPWSKECQKIHLGLVHIPNIFFRCCQFWCIIYEPLSNVPFCACLSQ